MDGSQAAITIQCGSCATAFRVPRDAAGKRGRCKKCGEEFRVPSTPPAPSEPASAGDGKIRFACATCGVSLKAPMAAAGRRVKCTKCSAVTTVPVPEMPATTSADSELGFGAGDDDLLAGLGGGSSLGGPTIPPPAPVLSSRSSSASASGGVAAMTGGAQAVAGALGGLARAGSPLVLGCVASAIGA